jgi:hypothetical protein
MEGAQAAHRRRRHDSFDARALPWEAGADAAAYGAHAAAVVGPAVARSQSSSSSSSSSPRCHHHLATQRVPQGASRPGVNPEELSFNLGAHSNCAGTCGLVHTLSALSRAGALFQPLDARGRPRHSFNTCVGVLGPSDAVG